MKAMQALQPQINALRSKYKSDPQRLQRETMELYRAHKVNPLGGCLPMVVQIPIFYALYVALSVSVEMQNAPFICFGRLFGMRPLDLRPGRPRPDVRAADPDGRLHVRPAEDDAGDGRSAPGEDDAVHARGLHLHVPEPARGSRPVLDACPTCFRSPSRSTWSGSARRTRFRRRERRRRREQARRARPARRADGRARRRSPGARPGPAMIGGRFQQYLDLFLRWNRTHRMTALDSAAMPLSRTSSSTRCSFWPSCPLARSRWWTSVPALGSPGYPFAWLIQRSR